MSKKLILYLVVVVLIILGGWWWWSGNKVEPVQEEAISEEVTEAEENLVTYDGLTFSPETIKVKVGDAVTFVNEGEDKEMWVASAKHPTHEILAGFDQLEEGEEYEYAFTQAGEWKYHNHLEPTVTGTVIVEAVVEE